MKDGDTTFLKLSDIRLRIGVAKQANATELTTKFHRRNEFNGWCVEVTVREHETCCGEKRPRARKRKGKV